MQRITRYILLELLVVFLLTLTGMTMLMLLVGLAQEAIRQGLGPVPILRLIPYVVPNALRFAVPGTILFAACSVYGRMSSSNEIIAIKSMGVSPMVAIWPALTLAFMVSLLAVWLNDVAVSWGRLGVRRVVVQSVEQIAYGMLKTNKSFSRNRFSINVRRVEGRRLIQPTLVFQTSANSPPITFTSDEAEISFNVVKNTLSFTMFNSELDIGGRAEGVFPNTIVHEVPLNIAADGGGPSDHALRQIPSRLREQREEIKRLEQTFAAEAAYQMLSGDFHELTGDSWAHRQAQLRGAQVLMHRLETEPWRRWANGFSCFFFVLVGAPLAIHLRTSDFWTTFGLCFLPILVTYYPLLMMGVDQAKTGEFPPYAVWLGNGILCLIGLYLLRKVTRS